MEQTSIEKALDVLYHLHASAAPQGVSQIGRALRLPKSTTHRLLASLLRRQLVEQDGQGAYRPGIALVALGLGALEHEPVVAAARPVLENYAAELGETIFLAAARAGRILVLDKQEGSGFLRAAPRIGAEIPVHATAIGKLYLGLAPELVLQTSAELVAHTPRTRVSASALRRETTKARVRGWAENREEWIPGLVGIAAPIFCSGRMIAAVAVAGPSSHFPVAGRERIAGSILNAARNIAARMEGGRS